MMNSNVKQLVIARAAWGAYEANQAYRKSIGQQVHVTEDFYSPPKRYVSGVLFILEHPNAPPEMIHDHWITSMHAAGCTLGDDEDAAGHHPNMKPFADLPRSQRTKSDIFSAVVRGVLVHYGLLDE